MNIFDTLFISAFISALASVVGFLLAAWGAVFIVWGGMKAARQIFWIEAEPWKGLQINRLEEARIRFGQRIAFGLDFFIAAQLILLIVNSTGANLMIVAVLGVVRVLIGVVLAREKENFQKTATVIVPVTAKTSKRVVTKK